MSAQTVQLGSVASRIAWIVRIGWNAYRFEPVRAALDDVLDASNGLDVVDHRRLVEDTFDGRKRRLDARPGALPFEALDQAGFFARLWDSIKLFFFKLFSN